MTEDPIFLKNTQNLKQPYCYIKVHWSVKFGGTVRDTVAFKVAHCVTFLSPKGSRYLSSVKCSG